MASLIYALDTLVLGRKAEERFLIVGNDGVGKTTLLYKLKLGEIVTTIPTIGFNVETIECKRTNYTFWDIGGCDRIRPIWRQYVSQSSHSLYVHDCTESEERVELSIEGLHLHIGQMMEIGARFFFVVFNKQDLLDPNDRVSIVSGYRQRFERELSQYDGKIVWTILDLPGFSASSQTQRQLLQMLDVVHATISANKKNGAPPAAVKSSTETPGHDRTSQTDLIARISKEGLDESDADTYWVAFLSGDLAEWNHRSHLRAGYLILIDTFLKGKGIFDATETFLDHLRRLKEGRPDRFRNTEHRTMTIFWLYNLQVAIVAYKQKARTDDWPSGDDFQQVLLCSPHLMDGGLWKDHYSKELMFSPEAKEYWRLPDLHGLPDFTQASQTKPHHIRRPSQEEPYRVMRFAFSVVQRYMSSDVRRGWLIKQALASLQSTTMRLRAKNPSVPPFSETQAYFWIQMVHAALASVYNTPYNKNPLHVSVDRLSFSSFRILFEMEPAVWKKYYTLKTWESIEARMNFMNPDLKSLPNVLDLPFPGNIERALNRQLDSAKFGMAAELPSMEDLALRATIVLEDVKSVQTPVSPDAKSHAHVLLYLYTNLVAQTADEASISYASRATNTMMSLSGPRVSSVTEKAFWTQQVLGVSGRQSTPSSDLGADQSKSTPSFEDFIKANLHLVYEDLTLCYYSPELLGSLEAKQGIVQPDRRKMRGFMALEDSVKDSEVDDWVVL